MNARKSLIILAAVAALIVPSAAHAAQANVNGSQSCAHIPSNVKLRTYTQGDVSGWVANKSFDDDWNDWYWEDHRWYSARNSGSWSVNSWGQISLSYTYAYC